MAKRKIYVAGLVSGTQAVDATTRDGRSMTIWAKPLADAAGVGSPSPLVTLKEESGEVFATVNRDQGKDWADVVVHAPMLTRFLVEKVMTGIFGPVELV